MGDALSVPFTLVWREERGLMCPRVFFASQPHSPFLPSLQSFPLTFRVRVLNLGKNAGCFQLCFAVYSLLAAKDVSRKISSSKERGEKAVLAG